MNALDKMAEMYKILKGFEYSYMGFVPEYVLRDQVTRSIVARNTN